MGGVVVLLADPQGASAALARSRTRKTEEEYYVEEG
jgi:hypothetical protein